MSLHSHTGGAGVLHLISPFHPFAPLSRKGSQTGSDHQALDHAYDIWRQHDFE
jgi:hypothetical protein